MSQGSLRNNSRSVYKMLQHVPLKHDASFKGQNRTVGFTLLIYFNCDLFFSNPNHLVLVAKPQTFLNIYQVIWCDLPH